MAQYFEFCYLILQLKKLILLHKLVLRYCSLRCITLAN